ncbi:MAG: YciI family protein [Cyclobacteriaceae bacterium]
MRNFAFVLITILCISAISAQEEKVKVNTSEPVTYIAAIVKRGDNWQQDSLRAFELQEKHLKFLENLKAKNKLIASGPLTSSPEARGLYVFNVKSVEEAVSLTQSDEAVSSGWIKMDFHVWASRDYEVPQPIVSQNEEETESDGVLGVGWTSALLGIFVLWIIVLAYRTFRMKASA